MYLFHEAIINSTTGLRKTIVSASSIYGIIERGAELGDMFQGFDLRITGDRRREISQFLVAINEQLVNILLQLRQTE